MVLNISTKWKGLVFVPGRTNGEVTCGGRKLKIVRPRVRNEEGEVPFPTYEYFKGEDPMNERILTQILIGVSTRKCETSLKTNLPDETSSKRNKQKFKRLVDSLQ